ncbi:MAG: MFS transporter [Verrucomicrobia bacterium]|nr:MFS transporter [Verrucomicrobiota bacterium]
MSDNEKKPLWPVGSLVVLTGLNLLDYLDRQLLAAVLTPIKEELKLSDESLGTIQSAFMWGYFLTSPIFGYLGDRVPRRWLVGAGVFVWSLGTLMSGHVSALGALIFFRVLVGFGEASFGTISPGWIADLFPTARRNNAISVFYLAIPVGSALGYILGSWIAAHHGWRAAFLWAGYPGLLLAFVLLLLREPARGAAEAPAGPAAAVPGKKPGWGAYVALLKFREYRLVIAGYVAQTFAMGGFALWAPTFLHRVHHMTNADAGDFFGKALVISGLVATLAGGFVATAWQKRTGRGYAGMLALSSLLTAPAAYVAFSAPDALVSKIALTASMFCIFLSTGPVNTLILETVPVTVRATAMAGSIFAIHMFGDLWSPRLVGLLSDRWNDLQRATVTVLPVALVVSAVFWCWLVLVTKPKGARVEAGQG